MCIYIRIYLSKRIQNLLCWSSSTGKVGSLLTRSNSDSLVSHPKMPLLTLDSSSLQSHPQYTIYPFTRVNFDSRSTRNLETVHSSNHFRDWFVKEQRRNLPIGLTKSSLDSNSLQSHSRATISEERSHLNDPVQRTIQKSTTANGLTNNTPKKNDEIRIAKWRKIIYMNIYIYTTYIFYNFGLLLNKSVKLFLGRDSKQLI